MTHTMTAYINSAKKLLLLFTIIIPISCSNETSTNDKTVTFEVILPEGCRDSVVYVTGNKEELGNWKADEIPLSKTPEGIWKKTFRLKKGERIEYKFTRGSWETEAANPDGSIPQNSVLDITNDTVITMFIGKWLSQSYSGTTSIPYKAFDNPIQMYFLNPYWKYHPGDDTTWASPAYDDKTWEVRSTQNTPGSNSTNNKWKGIGWFRLHINLDSSLIMKPIFLLNEQFGASEIYLNGKLVHKIGRIGNPREAEIDQIQYVPILVTFEKTSNQLLAIRYSNYKTLPIEKFGYNVGFRTILNEPEKFISALNVFNKNKIIAGMTFSGIPLILSLIHLLFFVFYPSDKTNLFYGLCLAAFSISYFCHYQQYFATSPQTLFSYGRLGILINPFIVLFGILSANAAYKDNSLKRIIFFITGAVIISIWGFISPTKTIIYIFYGYIIVSVLELLRLIFFRKEGKEGSPWIIGTGFGMLGIILIYNILIEIGIIKPIMGIIVDTGFGMLILIVAHSLNLSRGFARTHKNLEKQLRQVRELSDKTLVQERITRRQEMERKLLEADNKRKTQELEEARKFQLSMLPKTLPALPQLEIAALMNTATEVGGDYYDFKVTDKETLVAAIGDATGHGTKAGTMVTIAKILFNEFAIGDDLLDMLRKFTEAIKLMNLNKLYMGLTLLQLKGYNLKVASAGMPPFLIYHSKEKCVEEVVIKGMPLGSFTDFPYQLREFNFSKGDIVLLMSDGYIEQFNAEKEMLGIESAKVILQENCDKEAHEIIDKLLKKLSTWQNEYPQQDDVTFVVLKIK